MQLPIENAAPPGLWHRLAAIFYDSWLVAAIWLLGATVETFIRAGLGTGGDAGSHWPLQAFLLLSPALFFGWFWTHGGQTLGMRAWRLKLLDSSGNPVTWRQSLIRYGAAWLSLLALGLGYVWVWIDPQGLSWHDRLSGTRLVVLEKASN
ncbi:MAG: RDD family protein [Sedimenticolaceae bacterium]